MTEVEFRFCNQKDLPGVISLLRNSNLPIADISLTKIRFILALEERELVGCIGIERYEEHGLLRSLAVKQRCQNHGVGSKLFAQLMTYCEEKEITTIHLLTETADKYFLTRGFTIANRADAPTSIQQTAEFTELCPSSSSTYMVKKPFP